MKRSLRDLFRPLFGAGLFETQASVPLSTMSDRTQDEPLAGVPVAGRRLVLLLLKLQVQAPAVPIRHSFVIAGVLRWLRYLHIKQPRA